MAHTAMPVPDFAEQPEFYGRLFAWYEWAMKPKTGVTFPNELGDSGKDDQAFNAIALIRLVTRLMFTWFLRQRDLVPAMLFDPTSLGEILKKSDLTSGDEDNYYRCILQNLFFATFTSPRRDSSIRISRRRSSRSGGRTSNIRSRRASCIRSTCARC